MRGGIVDAQWRAGTALSTAESRVYSQELTVNALALALLVYLGYALLRAERF